MAGLKKPGTHSITLHTASGKKGWSGSEKAHCRNRRLEGLTSRAGGVLNGWANTGPESRLSGKVLPPFLATSLDKLGDFSKSRFPPL